MTAEKKPCQFCCWLRAQLYLIVMIVMFVVFGGHLVYFAFTGNHFIGGTWGTEANTKDVLRIFILLFVHIAGLIWSSVVVVKELTTCSIRNRY